MVSCIIDTQKRSVFHIDEDRKWVEREFEAFAQASAGRYRMFSLRQPDRDLIAAAVGGKLIVPKADRNAYVPVQRRATPEHLRALENAFLIARCDGGYRLTRYGESAAIVIAESRNAAPEESEAAPKKVGRRVTTPKAETVVVKVWFTIGGNQRQLKADLAKIQQAGIKASRLGALKPGSDLEQVSVPVAAEQQMIALGFKRSRKQPLPQPKER